MELLVVTPFGQKVKLGEVDEVVAPGEVGELGIRPGHLPLITSLSVGRFLYTKGSERRLFVVDGGYLEVTGERVLVVTESCEAPGDIDVEAARQALREAEEALRIVENQSDARRGPWTHRLRRARTRLEVAQSA